MGTKKNVVGIGELLWDMFPSGKQLGGAPFNFSFHASQAGCESYVVSAVGNDGLGEEIRSVVKSLGINDEFIQTNAHPTGTVSVKLNEKGHPGYTIHKNVAWDIILGQSALWTLAEKIDVVCFGSLAQRAVISHNTIMSFLNSVPAHCLKVFDINLRQNYFSKEIIAKSLMHANILKLNDEELPFLACWYSLNGNVERQLKKLMQYFGLEYIAYTMGSSGSLLLGKEESSFMEVPKVNVVDTVGAGDSFTAILVAGLLFEKPLKEIHKRATEVAAYVCTQQGATPKLPEYFLTQTAN